MARATLLKTSFAAGEISPRLLGRSDLSAYENGASRLRNVAIHPTGGVTRRPGLRYIATAAGEGRLASFEFNTEQVYLLLFTANKITVFRDDVPVAEIATPWTTAQIPQLVWVQSADVLFVAHPEVRTRRITRTSAPSASVPSSTLPPRITLPLAAPNIFTTFALPVFSSTRSRGRRSSSCAPSHSASL